MDMRLLKMDVYWTILIQYPLNAPTAFLHIPLDAASEHQIGITLYENLGRVRQGKIAKSQMRFTLRSYRALNIGSCRAIMPSASHFV